jgi:hypothetical protein
MVVNDVEEEVGDDDAPQYPLKDMPNFLIIWDL